MVRILRPEGEKVAESIREQARQKGMEDYFEEILVPTEEVVEMRRGQKINAERKFFPGYVLIKMDLVDDTWHLVKDTPKVTGFLGPRGRPTPISAASYLVSRAEQTSSPEGS